MIKALLFDLDGTLTDTLDLWYESVREIILKYTGKKLSRQEYVGKYWGMDAKSKIRLFITTDEQKVEEIYRELQQTLLKNAPLVKTFPVVKETLAHLSEKYKLAVISNSSMPFLEAQLENTKISKYLTVKIADAKPKPNPQGILDALEKLGVQKNEAIFIGDSQYDTKAGKNAGIKTKIIGEDIQNLKELLIEF